MKLFHWKCGGQLGDDGIVPNVDEGYTGGSVNDFRCYGFMEIDVNMMNCTHTFLSTPSENPIKVTEKKIKSH